jgi:hypothetical protein
MRIPSRKMPKALRRGTALARIIASMLLGAYLYGLWYHPLVVAIICAVVVAIVVRSKRRMRRQLTNLAQARKCESICDFSRAFDARNTDTWVIRAVYEQLQQQLRWVYPDFPVRATDRLIEDLMLDPDDIDMDVLSDVAGRTGRSIRNTKANPFYSRVKTAQDLVAFCCAQDKA